MLLASLLRRSRRVLLLRAHHVYDFSVHNGVWRVLDHLVAGLDAGYHFDSSAIVASDGDRNEFCFAIYNRCHLQTLRTEDQRRNRDEESGLLRSQFEVDLSVGARDELALTVVDIDFYK